MQQATSNVPIRGIIKDISDSLMKNDVVTHARNATFFSYKGDRPFYKTEQANRLVATLPFGTIIGSTELPDNTQLLFVTDNVQHGIFIFDPVTFNLEQLPINFDLNFSTASLITACSKQNTDCTFSVYWADGRRNPDRYLVVQKAQEFTADTARLARVTTPPTVTVEPQYTGVLPNGMYQAAIFYSMANLEFDRAFSTTLPVAIFNLENAETGSLLVNVKNLDKDYTEFKLVIIQTTKQTTTAKIVGTYPTRDTTVAITNFSDPSFITKPLASLAIQNPVYEASDEMQSNNEYLFRVGTQTVPDPDYQLQALDIKAKCVVKQVPENYYEYGQDVGHYRGEVYKYSIQLLHKLGFYSSAFVLKGRDAQGDDLSPATGSDVYEATVTSCETPRIVRNFEINDTAGPLEVTSNTFFDRCEGRIYAKCDLAYFESTDTYPNNTVQFGKYANKPIQLFKFPSEETIARTSIVNGNVYLNILGIEFSNVKRPIKDGKPDMDWVGYRIIREDLAGNRQVINTGIMSNTRLVQDNFNGTPVNVHYSNYPFNDLSPDAFISSRQTERKNSSERNFSPAKEYLKDTFNFYSPQYLIERRAITNEVEIVAEDFGKAEGYFEKVHNHPQQKLLSLFAYWCATLVGCLEAFLIITGRNDYSSRTETGTEASVPPKITNMTDFQREHKVSSVEDLLSLNLPAFIQDAINAKAFGKLATSLPVIVQALASLGTKTLLFNIYAIRKANEIIRIVNDFVGYTDYVYQYNAKATLANSRVIPQGFRRRFLSNIRYLTQGTTQLPDGTYINNFKKEDSIYFKINEETEALQTKDTTRRTMAEFKVNPGDTTLSTASFYYARSKRRLLNPYGRVESTNAPLLTHNGFFEFDKVSPVVFAGGCYINKVALKKTHHFFRQDQSNQLFPPGTGYDYRLYRNIGFPRFWANFFPFDFSLYQTINVSRILFPSFRRNTTVMHNLDKAGADRSNSWRVDNAYMYTSSNSVVEFYCESDYNLAFRERPKEQGSTAYMQGSQDLSNIFRSDRLLKEEFNIDKSYLKQANELFAQQQQPNFDPAVESTCFSYERNRLIYSLPQNQEQRFDNWQYFLAANTYLFPLSEFGKLTRIHRIIGSRLLFLFDKSSPYVTAGQDTLTLDESGRKITIGDGGLFVQAPQEILYTESAYGNSQSRFGTISTYAGSFYVSERQGKIFKFAENLSEISRDRISLWAKQYLPLQLTQLYPNYALADNTVAGVGYFMGMDAKFDVGYLTKKDYVPKEEFKKDITYDKGFYYQGAPIELISPYFEDISMTLSFDITSGDIISFHDWHPSWMLYSENSLFTVKGSTIWKHNDDCQQAPCTFYGKQYPFEIEVTAPTQFNVQTLSNLEYILESYKFLPDCVNYSHVFHDNFDRLLVYNTEQISDYLFPILPPANPLERIKYPLQTAKGFEVLSEKIEGKYRINSLRDVVKDRQTNTHLLVRSKNGYTFRVNPQAIDRNKPQSQRKMFRHYDTRIWLCKELPQNELVFKRVVTKQITSPR